MALLPIGKCDAIIAYSILHYVLVDQCIFSFLDQALSLLSPGGRLLLGDIPNSSMRRRFLSSDAGQAFHQQYTGRDEKPPINHQDIDYREINDAVVFALLLRAREAGFNAYVMPQNPDCPMANRREDLLFVRP